MVALHAEDKIELPPMGPTHTHTLLLMCSSSKKQSLTSFMCHTTLFPYYYACSLQLTWIHSCSTLDFHNLRAVLALGYHLPELLRLSPICTGIPFTLALPHSLCGEALKFSKCLLHTFHYYLTIKESSVNQVAIY